MRLALEKINRFRAYVGTAEVPYLVNEKLWFWLHRMKRLYTFTFAYGLLLLLLDEKDG